LFPYNFKCFSKRSHEKEEEDRGHVITLSDTNCLWDFYDFLLNFLYRNFVSVYYLDCGNKFWRGALLFKDAKQQCVVCCVVCFNKVNESYIQWQMVVLACIDKRF
jgi:hypothetical protein